MEAGRGAAHSYWVTTCCAGVWRARTAPATQGIAFFVLCICMSPLTLSSVKWCVAHGCPEKCLTRPGCHAVSPCLAGCTSCACDARLLSVRVHHRWAPRGRVSCCWMQVSPALAVNDDAFRRGRRNGELLEVKRGLLLSRYTACDAASSGNLELLQFVRSHACDCFPQCWQFPGATRTADLCWRMDARYTRLPTGLPLKKASWTTSGSSSTVAFPAAPSLWNMPCDWRHGSPTASRRRRRCMRRACRFTRRSGTSRRSRWAIARHASSSVMSTPVHAPSCRRTDNRSTSPHREHWSQ